MWAQIEVTEAGRPVYSLQEQDILVESDIGIYEGKYKASGYQNGRVYLTTQRICYVDSVEPTRAIGLKLSTIKEATYSSGFFKSAPKITLTVESDSRSGTDSPAVPTISITWICPICYYSNSLPADYEHGISELPVCSTCGIRADKELIENAIESSGKHIDTVQSAAASLANSSLSGDSKDPIGTQGGRKGNDTAGTAGSDGAPGNGAAGFPCPRCTFLNHPLLTHCEMCGAMLISSNLPPQLANNRIDSPGPMTALIPGAASGIVKLSFRGTGDKRFFENLQKVLQQKPWQVVGTPAVQRDRSGPGLHGLEQVGERHKQKTEQVLGSAFEDLQALMASAKEVVQLAESYAKYLEKQESAGVGGVGGGGGPADGSENAIAARKLLRESSAALGLNSSVVTKDTTREQDAFHRELAREITEFLQGGVLAREGGIIDLVDLFAMYNRARGVSLVSPSDLYEACNMMEKLKLPVRLRTFKSGVLVVQESYRTPQVIIRQILSWIQGLEEWKRASGVSIEDASTNFGWSVSVAMEEFEVAEQQGALCRDEQTSGIRYFGNQLVQWQSS